MTHPGVLLSLEEQTNGETHLCEPLSFALSLHREPGTTGEWEWDGENQPRAEERSAILLPLSMFQKASVRYN